MTHLQRLLLTLAVIFISLALGWITRRGAESGALGIASQTLDSIRTKLQTAAIFGLLPLSAMLSIWGIPEPEPGLLALPLLGLASYILGGVLALAAARIMRLSRIQTGSFYCCGTFTNIGAVGGLVCLLFLGENSIALVALYRLLEEIFYFSVAFPIAKWYSPDNKEQTLSFRSFKFTPMLGAIIAALGLGILLRLADVPRPGICGVLAAAAMFAATVFFLYAIGLTLCFSRIPGYVPQCAALCAIKFAIIPVLIIPLAMGMGYGDYDGGLPLRTAAILCSMPVAMTALVPPSLFRLDIDLANACWIVSTLCLIIVLPWLMFLLPYL